MNDRSQAERVLDALEIIDDLIVVSRSVDDLLREAIRNFIDIFACDRAFLQLFRPLGDAGVIEYTREPWPLVLEGKDHEQDEFLHKVIATARAREVVLSYGSEPGPGVEPIPATSVLHQQGVRSMMVVAIQPELGPSWFMGFHDCAKARRFEHEARLLERIAARLAHAVTSLESMAHLRQSEDRFRALVEHAPEAILIIDVGTQRLIDANVQAEQIFGWPPGQLLGASVEQLSPPTQPDGQSSELRITELLALVAAGQEQTFEWQHRRADGAPFPCEVRLVPLPNPERLLVRASVADITARRALERERERLDAQLHQAKRMEAIGQLTGGLAHDFNNFLTIITGQLELMGMARADAASFEAELALALDACEQAAGLTQQLLAFARQRELCPRRVQPGAELERITELLRRTLGAGVEVDVHAASAAHDCRLDATQFVSAIVNLCINARDAMTQRRGHLKLRCANQSMPPGARVSVDGEDIVGDFVVVEVHDDGSGISPELLARVCEPFFTTKAEGVGSGLGLSMVYGFVKQSGGHLEIQSELGVGTSIRLYFPPLFEQPAARLARESSAP
ncbi:PAS domain S-box protein [Pseudenhygromyxa sp. WMMC2535]|uniref:two-component system sensor histidine kinase NtrB n=1 Tax=Pseudenhygromyxa sp. WMMC2535 TaxID=2712867 RepID=UPI0015534443|nr:ATP-binding protein [Pseudenhygromyxa sp. WMMC2535]NVB37593.1 PAS domain S-box protein [Pseudenhygromyxa sp. WMMC2535]